MEEYSRLPNLRYPPQRKFWATRKLPYSGDCFSSSPEKNLWSEKSNHSVLYFAVDCWEGRHSPSIPSNDSPCPHSCPFASPRSSVDPPPRDPSGTVVIWRGCSRRMLMLWHQLNVIVVKLWPVASLFLRRNLVNHKAQSALWPSAYTWRASWCSPLELRGRCTFLKWIYL